MDKELLISKIRNTTTRWKLLDLLNNNYRCLFPIGALLALSGVAVLWSLSRDYARYGGDEAYQAPKI